MGNRKPKINNFSLSIRYYPINLIKEKTMENKINGSNKTRRNWVIDAALFLGALIASVSGIYFLSLTRWRIHGRQESLLWHPGHLRPHRLGMDPHLVELGFVAVALVHLVLHWKWVVSTTKRIFRSVIRQTKKPHERQRMAECDRGWH